MNDLVEVLVGIAAALYIVDYVIALIVEITR